MFFPYVRKRTGVSLLFAHRSLQSSGKERQKRRKGPLAKEGE